MDVEYEMVPVRQTGDAILLWMTVFRDISARKRQEAETAAQFERLRLITQVSTDLVWDLDVASGAIWWGSNFVEQMRCPGQEPPASLAEWLDFVVEDDRAAVAAGVEDFLESGTDRFRAEFRVRRGDGEIRTLLQRALLVRDSDRAPARVVGSLVDISEQRQLEEHVRRSQRMEALGKLTGGIAHDFNNLLAIVLGNAEVLKDALEHDAELAELAELTMEAAERGAQLTNRLLAFAGRQVLKPAAVDPDALIEGFAPLLRRTLRPDIALAFDRQGDGWRVMADRSQLELVLLNLALNAQDAMADGGSIHIATARHVVPSDAPASEVLTSGDYLCITLSDTGTGMSAEVLRRACEPFFTTRDGQRRAGLGLATAYGFAAQSGGDLRIVSAPGEGTQVRLILPRTDPAIDARPSAGAGIGHRLRVLAVDDEHAVRRHVALLLRGLGFDVEEAESGPAALERIESGARFDLLMTDIVMPGGMNGFDLARQALVRCPQLSVLYMSGFAVDARERTPDMPEAPVLAKPFRRAQLVEAVRSVIPAAFDDTGIR
ncbi:PAS domain-containing sensor histidine kinase [Sphingomonas sp. J315]|uniref:hybrid sensor histidine kinase/response regulator n=1 Tax=Sphingomonas sp. J315 TaxID=2898433 RepID=UPI0021ADC728|nr:ATP-binding protein [Sphingomonas sp. J315]UUX98166.1 response regulator [Sphingomonas sp. J315]